MMPCQCSSCFRYDNGLVFLIKYDEVMGLYFKTKTNVVAESTLFVKFRLFELLPECSRLFFFTLPTGFLLRPYEVTISSNLSFVHSLKEFQLNCVRDVIFTL